MWPQALGFGHCVVCGEAELVDEQESEDQPGSRSAVTAMHKDWSTCSTSGGNLSDDLVNHNGEAWVGVGPRCVVEMERDVVRMIGNSALVIAQREDQPVRVVAGEAG